MGYEPKELHPSTHISNMLPAFVNEGECVGFFIAITKIPHKSTLKGKVYFNSQFKPWSTGSVGVGLW